MKSKSFRLLRRSLLLILPLLLFALAGCSTTDNNAVMAAPGSDYSGPDSVARLHIGDAVTITFDGLPDAITPHEEIIREDGTINLPDVGRVKAAGRTAGELQDAIHALYVPQIYTHLTVTVKVGDRVFYVRGEVREPGRQIYAGPMTVSKAITSAKDFTDFANRSKVWLTRANGQRFKVNCDAILNGQAPDPPVYPGDQIEVSRRLF
jgi:polysaccharide export outer membrane protein